MECKLQSNIEIIDIHPGISYADIKKRFESIDKRHRHRQNFVVFLDEINTNPNVCGLLKDIQLDGYIDNLKLPEGLVILSAANP